MKGVTALAFASFVSFTAATGEAVAQTTKSLAGAYSLVSVGDLYGKNPAGILMFDGNGNYSLTITRSDLPKFASNSRLKGTGDENKAVVTGSITHFGRYSVKDKTLTFDVKGGSYPNWTGTSQARPLTVKGDQLSYKVAAPSGGGPGNEVVWKRMK
jgi:hypothetical protein